VSRTAQLDSFPRASTHLSPSGGLIQLHTPSHARAVPLPTTALRSPRAVYLMSTARSRQKGGGLTSTK
jgi:hypothetical protein